MRVIIMRGISGSGKSTLARRIAKKAKERGSTSSIISTDDYWDIDGEYHFDITNLQEAHSDCLRRFLKLLQGPDCPSMVIVDNTNIRASEIAPYYAVAKALGATVRIITVHRDVEGAISNNKHNTPADVVFEQQRNLVLETMPPWWKKEHRVGYYLKSGVFFDIGALLNGLAYGDG